MTSILFSSFVTNAPRKQVKHVGGFDGGSLADAMLDRPKIMRQITTPIGKALAIDPDLICYIDLECGKRWGEKAVQDFVLGILRDVRAKFPTLKFYGFHGASVIDLLASPLGTLVFKQIAAASPLGLIFPVYHSPTNALKGHVKFWMPKLEALKASGVKYILAVSKVSTGGDHATVDDAAFLGGLDLCCKYAGKVMIWWWGKAWDRQGAVEKALLALNQ